MIVDERRVQKTAKDLTAYLMGGMNIIDPSDEQFRERVSKLPLSYRSSFEEKWKKLESVVKSLYAAAENYLKDRERLFMIKNVLDAYRNFPPESRERALEVFRTKNPHYAPYVKNFGDLETLYTSMRSKVYQNRKSVIEKSSDIALTQTELHKIDKTIPEPKTIKGNKITVGAEAVATLVIAGAFTGLLAYFTNFMTHPATTGYAVLPDYGLTSILLSVAVIGALVVVFKKPH